MRLCLMQHGRPVAEEEDPVRALSDQGKNACDIKTWPEDGGRK